MPETLEAAPAIAPPGAARVADRMRPIVGLARAGLPILGAFVAVAAFVWIVAVWAAGAWGALPGSAATALALWCLWFFRDPERRADVDPRAILSPADGVVCAIGDAGPPAIGGGDCGSATRVSVFMNVFDVHVNRSPAAGRVVAVEHRAGRFFNASLDKASEHNERCAATLELADGRRMAVVQIAGLVARRIVCRARPGDELARGERFGMIRFGSRVDTYLPRGFAPAVRVGERVRAGETVIARPVSADGDRSEGDRP